MGAICAKEKPRRVEIVPDMNIPKAASKQVKFESVHSSSKPIPIQRQNTSGRDVLYKIISQDPIEQKGLRELGVYPVVEIWDLFDRGETLGKGGYGEVNLVQVRENHGLPYSVPECESGVGYAMKSMNKVRKGKSTLEAFLNEVRIHRQLKQEHVVDMVCAIASPDEYHIVTQLCLGGEVFDRVVSLKRFSENKASNIVRQMLLALSHCHANDIIHRDLKPSNFVFAYEEGALEDLNVKLIDFGLAKQVHGKELCTDKVGTPFYVSPETIDSRHPSFNSRNGKTLKASDMWSMGAIVFVLVTGKLPFPGRQHKDIFKKISRCRFKFSDTLLLSVAVKDFISSMLKLDPNERLTCEDALAHPWIADRDAVAPAAPLGELVIGNLSMFQQGTKLQKAVARVAVNFLTDRDKSMLQDLFAAYDHDHSGTIDVTELIALLSDTGFDPEAAKQEAQNIMDELDPKQVGALNVVEFAQLAARPRLSIGNDTMMMRTFQAMDKDNHGYVTKDEVKGALGDVVNEDYIKLIFNQADGNNDGRLTFPEFIEAMKKSISKPKVAKKRKTVMGIQFVPNAGTNASPKLASSKSIE